VTTLSTLSQSELENWMETFVPRRFLGNGHVQTIAGNFLPRTHPALPDPEVRIIEVQAASDTLAASHVLCHCHWQPKSIRSKRPTVILVHGLEGSSSSQYVVGNAARSWTAGLNVVRMNMRNCGSTEKLSPTLYHSGFSWDIGVVMDTFVQEYGCESFALIGYSMGGNLVMKLAGELGTNAPAYLKAAIGVSPAMDLAASADALHEPWNRVYEWKFLRGLIKRFARKVELYPEIYNFASAENLRTLREFDDRITAVYSGFTGADDYYARCSSAQFVSSIAVPTLVLHALDDPFVRMLPKTRAGLRGNPHITLVETANGGHCAFLGPRSEGDDGYWAENMLLRFVLRSTGN
jgi:predicted alpha/beta-fold hydrolase